MATNGRRQQVTGGTTANATHHSKEDALSDREFELLVEGTYEMGDYYALEARFVCLVAGRLGLRAGEIVHMTEEWIDWRRRMIVIPAHEPCGKGRDGGLCGYCRQLAEQRAEHNADVSIDEALAERWTPKTKAAAREVPFDAHPRAELVVEAYFDRFHAFQTSKTGLNRRLNRAAEKADGLCPDDVRPHGLRATAATYFASRGLDVIALQSMFGWANLSTARNYLARSGENTARAIRDVRL